MTTYVSSVLYSILRNIFKKLILVIEVFVYYNRCTKSIGHLAEASHMMCGVSYVF